MVFDAWGFDATRVPSGVSALFSGPPGTGKSMAAEVIATDLGVDLLRIDLSAVISKYIGETEKNLDGIFTAADAESAVLFFDESDALFAEPSDVHDVHDRCANLAAVSFVRRMQSHTGVSILATSARRRLPESLVRGFRFVVDFPFPDIEARRRIWQRVWPVRAPVAPDVDFARLAGDHELTGGGIVNVALRAAFLAAAEGAAAVTHAHLDRALRRERLKDAR
jgi:SpoVK/Ycf46/Vps4 family AAA+-type ATPase